MLPTSSIMAAAFALAGAVSTYAYGVSPVRHIGIRDSTTSSQVPIACYTDNGACDCPIDNNCDEGVLINVFLGYQCAYPHGACTWDDATGDLQNIYQTNCPTTAPCPSTGCVCPLDNYNNTGVLINTFKGFQCAYTGGACTWNSDGSLQNIYQTNCPTYAKCVQLWP